MLLSFARTDTVLYTNLGIGQAVDEALSSTGHTPLMHVQEIIATYHGRGNDEVVHRALKDFGFEQLLFKRFAAKIVSPSGRIILKITQATSEQLNFFLLWAKGGSPPVYRWV